MIIAFFAPENKYSKIIKHYLELNENIIFQYIGEAKLDFLLDLKIEYIISYNYSFIIPENIIKQYKNKIINLHISYLPWNRGADPNFWSWFDGTLKGITIHYIDEGIDTGDILVQRELGIWNKEETLASSYEKLHKRMVYLFTHSWGDIKRGIIKARKQPNEKIGSFHYKRHREPYNFLLERNGWNTPVKYIREYGRKMHG